MIHLSYNFIELSWLAYSDNCNNLLHMSMPFTDKYIRTSHIHTRTQIHYRAQALVFLIKQACFKCCIFLSYMRGKQLTVHRQHLPLIRRSHLRGAHPAQSANQPSSSLSSLGKNLYCCCRIWASFFRASSNSRSFLSISSWAAMIWGEGKQLTAFHSS